MRKKKNPNALIFVDTMKCSALVVLQVEGAGSFMSLYTTENIFTDVGFFFFKSFKNNTPFRCDRHFPHAVFVFSELKWKKIQNFKIPPAVFHENSARVTR